MKRNQHLIFGASSAIVSLLILSTVSLKTAPKYEQAPLPAVEVTVETKNNNVLHPVESFRNVSASLSREQNSLKTYIASRFNVKDENASTVVEHAYHISDKTGLHPNLLLAVAAVESGFDPKADYRGAKGIMQIQASAHEKQIRAIGGMRSLFDVKKNMQLGAEILQDCLARVNHNLRQGLLRYNGSSRPSNPYADKVLREKEKLDAVVLAQAGT